MPQDVDFDHFSKFFLSLPKAWLDFPFGENVYVYKVQKKMFGLIAWRDDVMNMNLKVTPENGEALRTFFPSIKPGYHMDKRHWVTVYFDGTVPNSEVESLIVDSYKLVVSGLPKKERIVLDSEIKERFPS